METLENRLQKRIHVSLYALLFLTTLLGLSVLLEGCSEKCQITNEYTYYEPVYTTIEAIRDGVEIMPPQKVQAAGKIYFKDGIIFVNEPGDGVHIFDDRDPSHPLPLSFLKIPGNYDLAVKGNTLYADSYVDLVAFDISDVNNIHEVSRLEGAFQNYQVLGYSIDPNCCVITGLEEKKNIFVYESDCNPASVQPWGGIRMDDGIAVNVYMAENFSAKAAIAPGTGSGSGVGGSLARFTISGDHLYLLDGADLETVNVSDEQNPVVKNRMFISWDIETIFPYKTNLFLGSSSGMHIIDISTPESPATISTYQHVTSCDPVVVNDAYAFVTLRSGTACQGFTNQLEVIDIKDLSSPVLLKAYPMTNPHGLGIDNKTLFVCDGSDGLKTFDATDIMALDKGLLAHYKNISALDVIPFNNVLMLIADDGIFQYDYTNPKDIQLLSKIDIINEL
jgi:hypothetical protein